MSKPKLGSGKRFAHLKSALAKKPGIHNPGALAAWIGRKKYGAKKMAQLSAHGRKHAHGGEIEEAEDMCAHGGMAHYAEGGNVHGEHVEFDEDDDLDNEPMGDVWSEDEYLATPHGQMDESPESGEYNWDEELDHRYADGGLIEDDEDESDMEGVGPGVKENYNPKLEAAHAKHVANKILRRRRR